MISQKLYWAGPSFAYAPSGTFFFAGLVTYSPAFIGRYQSPTQLGTATNWAALDVSLLSVFAVKTDGTLWAWGRNSSYDLGLGDAVSRSSPTQIGTLTNWASVTAGYYWGLAIKTDGTLWAWGNNDTYGQLGLGDMVNRSSPVQVGTDTNWAYVNTHQYSTFAIKTNGTLWSCGYNYNGQLALGVAGAAQTKSAFVQVGNLTNWSKAISYNNMSYFLKTDGTLWSCGYNGKGGLADGTVTSRSSPVKIGTATDWTNIAQVYGGHVNFVKSDGTLWTTGLNDAGQLGLGDTTNRSSPTKIGTLTNWATPYIKADGTLWTWGDNSTGLLGTNDFISRSSPTQVGTLTNWSKVAGGTGPMIAIKTDGSFWSWGGDQFGVQGRGTNLNPATFVDMSMVSPSLKSFSASYGVLHYIDSARRLYSYGYNTAGQLGTGNIIPVGVSPIQVGSLTNWDNVVTSLFTSHAISTDGKLWSWGQDGYGSAGTNTNGVNRSSPTQVGTLTDWSKVYCNGESYTNIAIKTDGTLWAWGNNNNGQLGDGTNTTRSSPVKIGTLTNWSIASCGTNVTIAIKTDGTMWSWGTNSGGVMGIGSRLTINRSSPNQIGADTNWVATSIGAGVGAAVKSNGTLWAWGDPSYGIYGNPAPSYYYSSFVQLNSDSTYTSSGMGQNHILAIKPNGTLWAWGGNTESGQLGLGDKLDRSSPVQVGTLTDWSTVSYSTMQRSVTIKTDGTLWVWGGAQYGSLGTSDATDRSSPTKVGTLTDWSSIVSGDYHCVARKTDGTLWTFGYNSRGQLGDSSATTRSSPVKVGTLTDWASVAAGTFTSGAIKTDGTLWMWGYNNYGQLGDGTITTRSSPVKIGTLTNWQSVSANIMSAAIKTDGTLWTWGLNNYGQLGNNTAGTGTYMSSPIQVGSLTDWAKVSTSGNHCAAIKTDGTLWTWGYNIYGQLGLGDLVNRSSPVQVGTATNWSTVTAIYNNTTARKTDNTLWGTGTNETGQLMQSVTSDTFRRPYQIDAATDWANVYVANNSILAQKTSGALYSIGDNTSYALGVNSFASTIYTLTQVVPAYAVGKVSISTLYETVVTAQ